MADVSLSSALEDLRHLHARGPSEDPARDYCYADNQYWPCHTARLLAAITAVLEQADDLIRKSEALDVESEYIAAEHPEAAAVAVLKRERSIAYDECARWFREAITRELVAARKGDSDER